MDKETAALVIGYLGGRIVRANGQVSICGLSTEDEWVFDVFDLDIERIELDEKIDKFKGSDLELRALLRDSESWNQATECPTLDIARIIRDELSDIPGAVIVYPNAKEGDWPGDIWELWLKTGPECPVYPSLKRRRLKREIFPPAEGKYPLCAILVKSITSGYPDWDFATFDGTNWQSFQHGMITGLTYKVIWSGELPDIGEIE